MPRNNRGGDRKGSPGVNYTQRTDLNEDRQPIRAISDGYGTAKASEDAQRIAPLPAAGGPPSPGGQGGGAAATPWSPPALVPLNAESRYPDRPVTNGLSLGPGAGPEILEPQVQPLERFRPLLPVMELAASRPGVSEETRNVIRRLRGALG